MTKYVSVAFVSLLLSSLSQILLKKSSQEKKKSFILEYLNLKVMVAYVILFICMLLTVYIYKGIEYKYGAIIESMSFLVVMSCSRMFLGEKISLNKLFGNIAIVVGVIIFSVKI